MATSRARRARKQAKQHLKTGTPSQKIAARATIKATTPILQAEKAVKGMSLTDLRGLRETQMGTRGKRFIGRDTTGKKPTLATTPSIEDTIAAANLARVYSDAMRDITERQKGLRTPYTGGGISIKGGAVDRPTQEAFEDVRFMAGPTDTQIRNIDWMLREGRGENVRDIRKDWREQVWDDTWNQDTGRWERGDRTAALETQAGLLDQPLPNIYDPDDPYLIKDTTTTTTGGAGQFVHPYAADPYRVPRMQTGPGWEGLGAEYQPGTVEGLGLLAGRAYAPYTPLRQGLLNARPSFMGTPRGFTPMDFKGGLDLGGDTTTNNNTWSPNWQFRGSGDTQQWGYYTQEGNWIGHNTSKTGAGER